MIKDFKTSYIPELELPDKKHTIKPNDIIILNRFSTEKWIVCFGWFTFDGNRNLNGWYLKKFDDYNTVKPVFDIDLYDIYFVESNTPSNPTPDIPEEPEVCNLYCIYDKETNTLTYYNSNVGDSTDGTQVICEDTNLIKIYLNEWHNFIPETLDKTLIKHIEVVDRITPPFTTLNHAMFGCENLESVNLSNLNVSRILDFSSMFKNCTNLITVDIHNWITNNAILFDSMFMGCSNLATLDIQFNTDRVVNVDNMFNGCINLEFDASNFNVNTITSHIDFNTDSKVTAPEWLDDMEKPDVDTDENNNNNGSVDNPNPDIDNEDNSVLNKEYQA